MATTRGRVRRGRIQVGWFFTDDRVKKAVAKAMYKALWKAGADLRQAARQGIKQKGKARAKTFAEASKRAKPGMGVIRAALKWEAEVMKRPASPPGSPPFTHTGFLRDDIVYAYDASKMSVVSGPYRVAWLNKLHEAGGSQNRWKIRNQKTGATFTTAREPKPPIGVLKTPVVRRRYRVMGRSAARYPARPYMKPALEKIAKRGKLANLFANSVK